ncbi:hypothetical protein EJ04DRAFT_125199 [Polyplosphaeria fusca]|uniref:Uncharacterized protein n=1 Tax=Polyplosphaeria fusca TaxID=682080 RepID=A0A9P4V2D4_9PLEO|nr:hypothetical protein EJ04DRAFT_125199 [Polyplosphaeria fusca]
MASSAAMPAEQAPAKLSFAKVVASSYKPQSPREAATKAGPTVVSSQPTVAPTETQNPAPGSTDAPKVRLEMDNSKRINDKAGNTANRTGQWANATGQQLVFEPMSKVDEGDKGPPSITLARALITEDSTTQLSSSDGSAKPASIDGKSVASATTFALDEKESIRPDDSASLRAVEEEDVTSPPDSVAAGSRVGSDSGVARAFRDQLHEIHVMGIPAAQRGAPPGRFPNINTNSTPALYDPNQPVNGTGRSMSQPLANALVVGGPPEDAHPVPDGKLIEALESPRDRLFVLKLEQDFIDFIRDSRDDEYSLPQCNTFYRMLAHRLADYYLLGHVVDQNAVGVMAGVQIRRTPICRIPPPLSGLPISSKNGGTPPTDLPARKIMRRGGEGKSGTNTTTNSEGPSKTTSEAGGPTGSEGGSDKNDGENKDKSVLTREEREMRYREARQRIFGNSENEEGDLTEASGTTEEKDPSRSSSASGKKKKKQRNYDDDGFEARSRFTGFYPQPYQAPGYGEDNAMLYGGYQGQLQNPQFQGMNAGSSPPPMYNGAYPVMMSQDPQSTYGWTGQNYQSSNGPMGYPPYAAMSNGYDLSADFQRGMQSFQSSGMASQATPKMANAPMAPYQDPYQPQPVPMNPGWPQMSQPSSFGMGQPPFAQNGPGNRPMSAPIHAPASVPYPYGQLPYNGKPTNNQHPIPGSFNRQQFNPQSQTFVPGSRNGPLPMQPNMAMPSQGMNGYGSYQMPLTPQMSVQLPNAPSQMPRSSPPAAYQPTSYHQTFGSPRSAQHANPVLQKNYGTPSSQSPQIASSQSNMGHVVPSQPTPPSIQTQNSIAKWGTPSHLPPKPPTPAQAQPPKFALPGHNFNVPRPPPGMPPGFVASSPLVIRGASGTPNMPSSNPT